MRILAATNRDLEEAVAQGTFRRDLYFRLNVLSLKIPQLRDRRQDIPRLTGTSWKGSRAGGHERTLNDDAMKAVLAYHWPGCVRELENCLERACAFTSGPVIHLADLPSVIHDKGLGLFFRKLPCCSKVQDFAHPTSARENLSRTSCFPHYNDAAERNAELQPSPGHPALSQRTTCTFWLQLTP